MHRRRGAPPAAPDYRRRGRRGPSTSASLRASGRYAGMVVLHLADPNARHIAFPRVSESLLFLKGTFSCPDLSLVFWCV